MFGVMLNEILTSLVEFMNLNFEHERFVLFFSYVFTTLI